MPMYRSRTIYIYPVLFLIAVLSSQAKAERFPQAVAVQAPFLVDSRWLAQHLHDPDIIIIDARSPADYQQSHIAGAINLPSIRTYQNAAKTRVLLMQDIEALLGGLGVENDSHVVVYGSAIYQDAARVFWALDLFGHTPLSLLDGAFPAWQAAGLPVDARSPPVTATTYQAAIHPGKMATRIHTLLAVGNPNVVIIDTRKEAEFQGVESRATRAGHIPSAIHIDKLENLEVRQGVNFLKDRPALEKIYARANDYHRIILYCNSGSESAIGYLVLRMLDKDVGLYDGAWQEWGNDPALPIVSAAP